MKKIIFILAFVLCYLTHYGQKTGTFKDPRDGKEYKTVKIEKQTWLAENLSFKSDSGCFAYNNVDSNIVKYGYLYIWKVAKEVCPIGWHLPNESEWIKLTNTLGGNKIAGGKLKSISTWDGSTKDTTNLTGFSALMSGGYKHDGSFDGIGNYGGCWSATEHNDDEAWDRYIANNNNEVVRVSSSKLIGLSVRCMKNR